MKSSSLIAILLVGAAVTAAPALAKTSLSKGKQVCEAAAKAQTPAPKSVRTDDDATKSNDATITYKLKIKSAEDKAGKYRTQQLEVRKNDEYKALTHEIETTEAAIGGFEEEELKVMYAIDEAKKRFAAAQLGDQIVAKLVLYRPLRQLFFGELTPPQRP